MHRRFATACIVASAAVLVACGSQGIELASDATPDVHRGAELFSDRCSACHSLDVVGAHGGATKINDRERVDGPDFNVRPEKVDDVLYAIENGGFSGAIMPENIVVGQDARDVAAFLAKYAGRKAPKSSSAAAGG